MYVQNKVALITGGASGLGFIYATELLKNGAKGVALADVNVSYGNEAVSKITKKFGQNKAIFIKVDVTDKKQLEDAMKKIVESFGNFDILINNAGIMNDSIWEKEVAININGLVNGCMLAFEEYLPKYKSKSCEPTIINVSSCAAFDPIFFLPIYTGTKNAVIGISRTFAAEQNYNSKKVRILTLCPSGTNTPLVEALETKSFTPRHTAAIQERFNGNIFQAPEVVGTAMIKILENGGNGSVWAIENGKLFEVEIPYLKDMKILRYL